MTFHRTTIVLLGLTWAVLGSLAVAIAAGVLGAGELSWGLAVLLPEEFVPRRGVLTVLIAGFGMCLEGAVVVTAVLVGYIVMDRIFRPSALRWVDGLVVAAVGGTAFVFAALFAIPGPPQLFGLAVCGFLLCAAATGVLLLMRTLLRRAIAMRVELDEVV